MCYLFLFPMFLHCSAVLCIRIDVSTVRIRVCVCHFFLRSCVCAS